MNRATPTQILLTRITRVSQCLPAAGRCDPEAVHDARVATRRLREALPVLARGKRGRALLKAARRITRALGPVRELDVALTTLAEFGGVEGVSRASVAHLRSMIAEERRRHCAGMQGRLERCGLLALGARAAREAGTPLTLQAVRALLAEAELRGGRRASRLRLMIEAAAGMYLPDRLHDVRIGVKKLRYAMELAQDLRAAARSSRTAPPATALKTHMARLRILRTEQDILGRMHDIEVLIARVRALQGTSAVTALRLSADLDQLVRRMENECRDLHGQYMAARGRLLEVCNHAEAASRRHGSRRQTA